MNSIIDAIKRKSGYSRYVNYKRSHHVDGIFVWIPKCAGTSVVLTLKKFNCLKLLNPDMIRYYFPNRGLVTFGHMKFDLILRNKLISKKFSDNAINFTFVRNPFDRFISIYEYYKLLGRIDETMSFQRFSEVALEGNYKQAGLFNDDGELSHMNCQVEYITDNDGHQLVDFIGRYENLEKDFTKVLGELKVDRKLFKCNPSPRKEVNLYYSRSCVVRNVMKAYEKDFDLLNYSTKIR